MEKEKYTQAHILASEAFANLATLLGRSLQVSHYLLYHPDYKPHEVVINPAPEASAGNAEPVKDEPASAEPAAAAPGMIHSGEPDEDTQIDQVTCLYDPRLREQLDGIVLYDMFRFATAQFNYEMKTDDPDQELSGADKRKIALAWIVVKRAFVINHYSEVMHILNLPDIITGRLVYNDPVQVQGLTERDRQDIALSCSLLAEFVDNATPLSILIENALALLEREEMASRLDTLPAISSLPNGDPLNFLLRVASNKKEQIIKSSKKNRHETIEIKYKGDAVRLTKINKEKGSTISVSIARPDELFGKSNKTFKKLLVFVLQKMARQNNPLEVGFSLQELIDLKMYNTTSNAWRAIGVFIKQSSNIFLTGTIKTGRKTVDNSNAGLMFYNAELNNGYVTISVNEKFNIDFIASQYTMFPRFAYSLKSSNAFDLIRYIFYIARQNTSSIKDKGSFTIGLDSIRSNLGLPAPDEVKNRKYKQYIIDPIEDAIEEIEEAIRTIPEAQEYGLTITPAGTNTTNIQQWLSGYLVIGLNGDFAKSFIEMATKAEAQRERWNRIKTAELAKLAAKKEAAAAKSETEEQ